MKIWLVIVVLMRGGVNWGAGGAHTSTEKVEMPSMVACETKAKSMAETKQQTHFGFYEIKAYCLEGK